MDKQIFKRILDNMDFVMYLSDNIPEHTMIDRDRIAHGTESLFAKLVEGFNEKLRPRLGATVTVTVTSTATTFTATTTASTTVRRSPFQRSLWIR
jgi:hypothetical protein